VSAPNAQFPLPPEHYLGLFTIESWREFKVHGGRVMGFTEKKKLMAGRLKPGDKILCYVSKVSTFVGVMEVTGPAYWDTAKIWSDGIFPVRLPVKIVEELPLSHAIPIRTLAEKLSFMKLGTGWTIHVRSSPRRWTPADARTVVEAVAAKARTIASGQTGQLHEAVEERSGNLRKALPQSVRVGRVMEKTRGIMESGQTELLGSYENALSFNKVTGYSVNVPIGATCRPTAVCMKTCYFAVGAPSWSNSLRHQWKVMATMQANPAAFAERVAMEYDRLGLTFIRWNGGGDLFKENVEAINHLGKIRPDIPIWVVTRLPDWAAQIEQAPNVFIHFSLDKHSLGRRADFLKQKPRSLNHFFSYQCDKDEVPDAAGLEGIAVLFFDSYKPTGDVRKYRREVVCPLNGKDDITDVCRRCRRCFDGSAVSFR